MCVNVLLLFFVEWFCHSVFKIDAFGLNRNDCKVYAVHCTHKCTTLNQHMEQFFDLCLCVFINFLSPHFKQIEQQRNRRRRKTHCR